MSENVPAVWQRFAEVCGLDGDPGRAREVLASTIMPKGSQAEITAFVAVCSQYRLNPLRKEIYAFPSRNGVQAMVGVDGWFAIANRHPEHESIETEEIEHADGSLKAVRARVFKRGSDRPTTATEYLDECRGNTEPWKRWPRRMLANKAMIQAIRRAYAVSGIVDEDEADRIRQAEAREAKTTSTAQTLIERAKAVAEPAPELEIQEEEAFVPTAEDMADWTQPVTTDPEAAQ